MDMSMLLPLMLNMKGGGAQNPALSDMLMGMLTKNAGANRDPMAAGLMSMLKKGSSGKQSDSVEQNIERQGEALSRGRVGFGLAPIKDFCPYELLHAIRNYFNKENEKI